MQTFKNTHITPLRAWEKHMNILLISALLLGGCKTTDPIATPLLNTDYSIVDGDTIKTVVFKDHKKLKDKDPNGKNYIVVGDTIVLYKEPKLHTPPAKDPDLSKLKNNDDPDLKGKPLRMVAIGGSLTAGVRDGGYFNEGILTSYPNLIARQMKLKKFEQPLFDATDYNGFGRKVRTGFNPTGGPVPKFNEVKNNSGVEAIVETIGRFNQGKVENISLKKYKGEVENFAIPNMKIGILSPYNKVKDIDFEYDIKPKKEFLKRVVSDENLTFTEKVFSKKFDFFIYEMGWDDVWERYMSKNSIRYPSEDNQLRFMQKMKESKVKYGCFVNMPNIFDLPFFKSINDKMIDDIVNQYSEVGIFVSNQVSNSVGTTRTKHSMFLPHSDIDSMVSVKVHPTLKKGIDKSRPISYLSILSRDDTYNPFNSIKTANVSYNTQVVAFAKDFDCPLVDINSLYTKVLKGEYTTDDGIRVDGSWPNGNFFSADGLYPTAFGQAIIANEAIKAINAHYKMEIPLISTREYLNIK